jgi:sugar/nucleoside kinase (ribokinase family)
MKILGIGNAIVDVLCKVSDDFLTKNSLTKGTMKLIDENEFKNLISSLKIEETISGGSVANSIVGLSQLGNQVGFIGKVNDDNLGKKYENGLVKEGVKYLYKKKKEPIDTGSCLILITPDSERTMCTFLGIAGKISDQDIDKENITKSQITFLEGYLWDEGSPKKAFDKVIDLSKTTAMSLSDQFCVDRHKISFLNLVKNRLDIVFANEQEIFSLINTNSINEVIDFSKQLKKLIIITRGEKGAIAINHNEIFECESKKNLHIKDLTGAGDLFAAGFLHGVINNYEIQKCLQTGTELSAKIIEKIGARI